MYAPQGETTPCEPRGQFFWLVGLVFLVFRFLLRGGGCARSSLLHRFVSIVAAGQGWGRGSQLHFQCVGFSLQWLLFFPSKASVVVTHGLGCSEAWGIFPDQGLNLRPLHLQVDSSPLDHQGTSKVGTVVDSFPPTGDWCWACLSFSSLPRAEPCFTKWRCLSSRAPHILSSFTSLGGQESRSLICRQPSFFPGQMRAGTASLPGSCDQGTKNGHGSPVGTHTSSSETPRLIQASVWSQSTRGAGGAPGRPPGRFVVPSWPRNCYAQGS